MIKKILSFFVLVLLITTGCTQKEADNVNTLEKILSRGEIIVGVKSDTYPFGYYDSKGNLSGFDVDLSKAIAKEIFNSDGHVRFVTVDSSNRMMKLYSEEIDMIAATMSVTPQRQQILDFSDSYYSAGQAMLVRSGNKIENLRDLNGKIAIIVFGSTSEKSLRTAVPNVKILGYRNYNDAYNALKSGKAEAIVSDDTILLGMALKDKSLKLLPRRYTKEPYAIAFRKSPESKELIKSVNNILGTMRRNGKLKNLREKYGIN